MRARCAATSFKNKEVNRACEAAVPARAERMVVMSAKMMSVALAALFGVAVVGFGCDEKLAEEKKVDVKDDGTVVTEKRTVTEKDDGSIVEEKSKDVDKPADDDVDVDADADEDVKLKVDVDEK